MASPSAASSRIDPRLTPVKMRPANCARQSRASTVFRLPRASWRTSASGSEASANGTSSVLVFGLPDDASARIAAMRVALSGDWRSIDAAMSVSDALMPGSVSRESAFFTSAAVVSPALEARLFTAARRASTSDDNSASDARPASISPRKRLLTITSSFSPPTATSPCAICRSSAGHRSSPEATSAAITAAFSSPSPVESLRSVASSTPARARKDSASNAASSSARKFVSPSGRRRSRRRRPVSLSSMRPLGLLRRGGGLHRHVGLVLLLVVARDERAPGLGLDRARRLPDDVELAVGRDLADEHRLVQVVVFRVHRRDEPSRRLEGLPGHGGDDLVGVEALRLLDRLLPHVHADVRGFHRVVGERLVLVAGDALGLRVRRPFL